MSEDWRLTNARHLKGQRLRRQPYRVWSKNWDHDHCAACWAAFAVTESPDALHEGYATCADYRHGAEYDWVCARCFAELKDAMGWTEAS